MKKITLLLGIICVTFLFSCKKDVTACIEMDNNSVSVGQSITFTSCSENELSYDWRITGPDNAPENNLGWSDKVIIVPFSISGSYSISLSAYNKFSLLGDKSTATTNFTVN